MTTILTMINGETWWVQENLKQTAELIHVGRTDGVLIALQRTGIPKSMIFLDPHQVSSIRDSDG